MDEWWCQTVSVTGFGLCWANDTLVPEWSQIYPGGFSISTGFDGPAHTQETRMSDALLQSVLTTYTSIPPRSNDPRSARSKPAEAMFYGDIEFAGEALGVVVICRLLERIGTTGSRRCTCRPGGRSCSTSTLTTAATH